MSDQRQLELFEQIRTKFCEQGFSPNYASNIKVILENALQSYVNQVPRKIDRKEALTPEITLQKLRKIRTKALLISIAILFGIIPFCLISWSVYQSFATCDGLFEDKIEGYLSWHQHYKKFCFNYGTFYNPKNETNLFKYPWMVRFTLLEQNLSNFKCSGFLINDRDILTAGHCFFLDQQYDIHLGGTPANNYNDGICVKNNQYQVFVHPEYNHTLVKNDIALVKLNEPIKFSDTIHPIRLSFYKSFVPKMLTLTGWNSSDPYRNPKLKENIITTIPVQKCINKTKKTIDDKVMIGTFYSERIPVKFCGGHSGKI
ncbi:hypothetical protein ACKWTF_010162 [Chironomus riparius]